MFKNCGMGLASLLGFLLLSISSVIAGDRQTGRGMGWSQRKPEGGRFVKTGSGYMTPYKATIPGTDVTFEMVPIPGGTFTMGSPAAEKKRAKDEGPQFKVRLEPFWMSKYEITNAQYRRFRPEHSSKDYDGHSLDGDVVPFRPSICD